MLRGLLAHVGAWGCGGGRRPLRPLVGLLLVRPAPLPGATRRALRRQRRVTCNQRTRPLTSPVSVSWSCCILLQAKIIGLDYFTCILHTLHCLWKADTVYRSIRLLLASIAYSYTQTFHSGNPLGILQRLTFRCKLSMKNLYPIRKQPLASLNKVLPFTC